MSSRPEAQRALLRADATLGDDEAERFYALRVSDYACVLTLIFTIIYVVGVVATLIVAPDAFLAFHLHPAKLANLAFVVLGAGIWRLAASPRCPRWIVVASDAFLPVGVALTAVLASSSVPRGLGLFVVPLLLMALLVMLRAALVPSAPGRTALVEVQQRFQSSRPLASSRRATRTSNFPSR